MKISPIGNKVLVELDPLEETFNSSVIIRPNIAQEKPVWGKVLAIGEGLYTRKSAFIRTELNAGDRVFIPWRSGHDFKINGKLHIFVKESDIMAVYNG